MQAQLVGSIWSNVLQQYPQHDDGEKNYVSRESMRTRKAWHGIYKVFLVWLCNILTQTETD